MSGGGITKIGEMALIGMAAPELAPMFASDAGAMAASDAATSTIASNVAMSTIPTATDVAGQLANPFSDQTLLTSGADDLPGTLSGSSVASASPLQSRGIESLTSGMDKSALGNNLTSEFWNSQYGPTTQAALDQTTQGALNQTTQGALNATANPYALSAPGTNTPSGINLARSLTPGMGATAPADALTSLGTNAGSSPSMLSQLINWAKTNPAQAAAMGLGANYLFNKMAMPNYLPGYTPPSAASYGLGRTLAAGYQPVRPMAEGGITSLNVGPGSVPTQGVAPSDLMQKPNQGAGLDSLAAQYGISPQMVSQARQTYGFSAGGPTEMAVGGKLLNGHGDGMSDSIKANISGSQEARLGDGEFVVPADVVSHLGNGSTDAGAKQLYSMMDKVRKARTGRKAQGRQINPQQYMPA